MSGDMDRQRGHRRQPARAEHGKGGDETSPRHGRPHFFIPAGSDIFFMSISPALPAPAGAWAPTPCTSSETFTLPALSNSSVTGTLSPCLNGLLGLSII